MRTLLLLTLVVCPRLAAGDARHVVEKAAAGTSQASNQQSPDARGAFTVQATLPRVLTVRSAKPVVAVGSMRNPSTLGYEGAANLLDGFRVAASPDARGKGVLVVLNDQINAARDVTKTDALRLDTIQRIFTEY